MTERPTPNIIQLKIIHLKVCNDFVYVQVYAYTWFWFLHVVWTSFVHPVISAVISASSEQGLQRPLKESIQGD